MTQILVVNIKAEEGVSPEELARRLREVADKVEQGHRGGSATVPLLSHGPGTVGSYYFGEFDEKGRMIPEGQTSPMYRHISPKS